MLHNHPVAGPLSACYDEPAAREMATVHAAPLSTRARCFIMRVGCRFGLLGLQLGDALDLPRIELARRRRIVLTDPIDQDHIEAPGLLRSSSNRAYSGE